MLVTCMVSTCTILHGFHLYHTKLSHVCQLQAAVPVGGAVQLQDSGSHLQRVHAVAFVIIIIHKVHCAKLCASACTRSRCAASCCCQVLLLLLLLLVRRSKGHHGSDAGMDT